MQSGKKLTLGILPTFLCLLSLLIVACGGGSDSTSTSTVQKAADNKQVFMDATPVAGLSDVKTIDPALDGDLYSANVINMVYTGLVSFDAKLNVVDELAASHSVAADGVTYTFKMKPNLMFSDGTPLTSKDVAYSIDRALQPATKSPVAGTYLNLVKDSDKLLAGKIKTIIGTGIMTPDDNTVIIVTNKKAAYFLSTLTYQDAYVVEKKLIDQYGTRFTDHLADGQGGGSGPFMIKKYARGQEIDFVPNPHYYGAKPQLKEVIFPFYKDRATLYKAYQTGVVDNTGVQSVHLAEAKKLTKEFHSVPQLAISYYTMNYLVKPFNNIKVRQAFALALNKQELVHSVYKDTQIATNHMVPQGMPGYYDALKGPDGTQSLTGNSTQAKKLLTEGLQEEGMTIASLGTVSIYSSSAGDADVRNEFAVEQQMYQNALGITVKYVDEDFNKLTSDIIAATGNPKGIAMWGLGWGADYPDPQDFTTLQVDNGSPQNNMNYGQNNSANSATQKATQQQLVAADANSDQAARIKQYNAAEQQMINDVAWLPTFQQASQGLRKPCIVGVPDSATGQIYPVSWASIYKSTDTNCSNATVNV